MKTYDTVFNEICCAFEQSYLAPALRCRRSVSPYRHVLQCRPQLPILSHVRSLAVASLRPCRAVPGICRICQHVITCSSACLHPPSSPSFRALDCLPPPLVSWTDYLNSAISSAVDAARRDGSASGAPDSDV